MDDNLRSYFASLGGDAVVPQSVIDFPGMTSTGEKEALYRLGRQHFRGNGAIIDAGLFLGASTNAFATGITDNRHVYDRTIQSGLRPIKAYEIAIWASSGFDKYLESPLVKAAMNGQSYRDGENYFPTLERLLSPHKALIEFRIGDIVKLASIDTPVEIAFYDCLKNYERDWAAFKAFAPHFIPGHTVVVQQDYFYEDALDNKLRQEFLAPHFKYLGASATSAFFQLTSSIPEEYFKEDPLKSLSVEQEVALLENAAQRPAAPAFQIYAELGVVRHMLVRGQREAAAERLRVVETRIQSTSSLPERPTTIAAQVRRWLEGK